MVSHDNLLSLLGLFGRSEELNLNAVDSVDRVDEEDEDEDEGNLHPILYFRYYRVFRNEAVTILLVYWQG